MIYPYRELKLDDHLEIADTDTGDMVKITKIKFRAPTMRDRGAKAARSSFFQFLLRAQKDSVDTESDADNEENLSDEKGIFGMANAIKLATVSEIEAIEKSFFELWASPNVCFMVDDEQKEFRFKKEYIYDMPLGFFDKLVGAYVYYFLLDTISQTNS